MSPTVSALILLSVALAGTVRGQPPVGVGVVNVPFARPLYLYDDAAAPAPFDSLTFRSNAHSIEIATAPPWFSSEAHLPGTLYLPALTLGRQRIEVVVQRFDTDRPRTAWIDREAVTVRAWAEFLLAVATIEPRTSEATSLHTSPQDGAEPVPSDQHEYRVLAVRGSWVLVEGADFREVGTPQGWLRWRRGEQILIRYNLLS